MKKLKELDLKDDFLFSKVMVDLGIAKEFLEKLLEVEIERIEIPESQKSINFKVDSKGVRFDIYVKGDNTVYNIEMQREDKDNIPKRMRYYQGNIDVDLISKGTLYHSLSKSYIIFICTFDMFKKGRYKYTFEQMCVEDNSIKLKDDSVKIVLNTKGFENDISSELIEFLDYIEHSNDETAEKSKSSLVKKTHKRVIEVKENYDVGVEFVTLYEKYQEYFEKGEEEGRAKGMKEGEHKRTIDIAKNLLDILDDDTISKKTGISLEEIKLLRGEV